MDYICIGPRGWGRAETVRAAIARCRDNADNMDEYLVWECPGNRDAYQVNPVCGSLEWNQGAPDPIRVRRRYRDGTMDRTRRPVAELRGEAGQ